MVGSNGCGFPFQEGLFLGLFSARDEKTTLVAAFSYALQQLAISFVSLAIVTSLTSPLQNRLDIVQHQQAATYSQVLDQQGDLTVYLFWQDCLLLIRDKLDALLQDAFERWRIEE